MVDDELAGLAGLHGVATRYADWRGREVAVSRDTLVAVLGALGVDASSPSAVRKGLERHREGRRSGPPTLIVRRADGSVAGQILAALRSRLRPGEHLEVDISTGAAEVLSPPGTEAQGFRPLAELADVPSGWHRLRVRAWTEGTFHPRGGAAGSPSGRHRIRTRRGRAMSATVLVAPDSLAPPPRSWGFTAQLYSVRSRASWGLGDLHDLADLAAWSGRELGAGFVLVNPLHASEPVPPIAPSPYAPMSRRFPSPIYLRVEDMPEYAALPPEDRERFAAMAARLRAREGLLDRDAVWTAKMSAFEAMYRLRGDRRDPELDAFRRREGETAEAFTVWCAIAEEQGTADWRRWPARLRTHGGRAEYHDRARFYEWLLWRLDGQLAAAQRAARDAGMPVGIVHDLAVGAPHGSADAWVYGGALAQGVSVGAPPDEFNQRGQDWGLQPWRWRDPGAEDYRPFREMAASALRHGGGVRLDHAMQVSRLWWIPEGASPAEGTYVRCDRDALLACLTWEAERFGGVVVGEDLGTVEPEVRDALADHGVLGTSLLWFERGADERPKPARQWRELSLATVGTHDMPPITGFVHGDHIELRDRLGLLAHSRAAEEDDHHRILSGWLALLRAENLLATPPGQIMRALAEGSTEHDGEIVTALHDFLTLTPARLIGISLADAVGERRTQNQPGTVDEYPNWRVPLAGSDGAPVLLEDLQDGGAPRLFRRGSM
ncbi:4-alpha-glucanotransferase [Actinomadura sp. KC216]|uniref:4-alpha-glucanotransferase n=1 Tax=Actinomadura sp. KC216 TaxID=2530370 RepID=UPI001051F4EA|nr:4-alpha-glucanotransferase [Actinomadura sp. KC216]TDB88898.1 4-alpha-glucanotransferase [Actinomadura sp. KC216]